MTNPDLIVMDFGLPDTTGDKVISRLKADPITKRIPVIATTGYMPTEITKRVLAAGAATVLLKPYHIDELVDRIEGCSVEAPLPARAHNLPSRGHASR